MILRQDIGVLFFHNLGYSRIRNFFFRFVKKPVTRFIAFHDVLPEALTTFKSKMRFLKLNTNVVSLDDYFAGAVSSDQINIVITFDDGYKSWVSRVGPVLKELGLPATFFVASGFIGLSKEEECEFVRTKLFSTLGYRRISGSLNEEDLRMLVKEGFSIGGHTKNHCILERIPDKSKIRNEILADKLRLGQMTGINIKYFAYPSGGYNNPEINLVELLRQIGYEGAVTTEPGFNTIGSSPYLLHRDLTRASMSGRVFRARVLGNYDAVLLVKKWVKLIR